MTGTTTLPRQLGAVPLRPVWALMVACLVFALPLDTSADCKTKAVTQRETSVFEHPSTTFNTASGWVYGTPVAVLASNITVFVCNNRTVRFGVITQSWLEIAYWNGQKWQHGWIVADNVNMAALESKAATLASFIERILPIPAARAQAPPIITENPPASAGAPPPPSQPSATGVASADGSGISLFYAVLFVCMLLGMLGKVLFDALTAAEAVDWKVRGRAGIVPLLVSPIVFLGIMKTADAAASAELASFISIACVAFQNGFFWHTIFDRTGAPPQGH